MSDPPNHTQTSDIYTDVDSRDAETVGRASDDDAEAYRWLNDHDDPYERPLTGSNTPSDQGDGNDEARLLDNSTGSNGLAGPFSPIRNRTRGYSFASSTATASGERAEEDEKKPVSWRSLPHRSQLAIITLARLSEPLAQTSLQAYMFYQLKSFDPSLPDGTISKQTGIIQGAFTAAQFVTSIMWGRLADTETFGRKRVLVIGLMGTAISCLGFGFSKSFTSAVIFRTLGGALNSNIGVLRTMISEIIEKKKYFPYFLEYFSLQSTDRVQVPIASFFASSNVLQCWYRYRPDSRWCSGRSHKVLPRCIWTGFFLWWEGRRRVDAQVAICSS